MSKAIDKAAGAEREVVAESRWGDRDSDRMLGQVNDDGWEPSGSAVTAPATPEAAQWEGFGTALKPSHEPIVIARKPLSAAGVSVQANIENGLREKGVVGEIQWTKRPASDAAALDPSTNSFETPRPPTGATSANPAAGSEMVNDGSPNASDSEPTTPTGERPTESTCEPTLAAAAKLFEQRSSMPTEEHVPAAASGSAPSSPSTTSKEAGRPTAEKFTARSTSRSSAKDSPTPIESFAGIATGLSGSRAVVHIKRLSNGTFEWPSDLLEKTPGGSTVAANVLEHGCGALNIDGCRIEAFDDQLREKYASVQGAGSRENTIFGKDARSRAGAERRSAGRWPANVVLSHLEECEPAGVRRVATGTASPKSRGLTGGIFGDGSGEGHPGGYADEDGTETVEAWNCAPGCPVAELDAQSGERRSAGQYTKGAKGGANDFRGPASINIDGLSAAQYADFGGASRFFYCAKASRGEREAGLDALALRTADPYAEHRGRRMEDKSRFDGEPAKVGRNHHPTVKPLDLMRWLVRLVTPPGGVCLDPFAGSGSTGCAAVLEGFDFIGIEREPEYVAIAEARIAFWAQHEGKDVAEVLGLHAASQREAKQHADQGQMSIEQVLEEAA